jgi:hypothetical protein
MSLKCGIVGLPNVGKSTLFNALTKAGIAGESYPFCTIEPNTGVIEVPDLRLQQLYDIVQPERVVPAIVEFVDIAGLVAGAKSRKILLSNGKELGSGSRCAAISAMRRVVHEGHTPLPLQEKATRKSCPQSSQRARAKPWAKMPHSRYFSKALRT